MSDTTDRSVADWRGEEKRQAGGWVWVVVVVVRRVEGGGGPWDRLNLLILEGSHGGEVAV